MVGGAGDLLCGVVEGGGEGLVYVLVFFRGRRGFVVGLGPFWRSSDRAIAAEEVGYEVVLGCAD